MFAQLLRDRHVSRAATALGLSQPAASNALRRLRAELGDELFHRTANGMQPTAYALHVAPAITQALDLIGDALSSAQAFDPVRDQRGFALAMSDVGQIYCLPLLMKALGREAPQVSLRTVGLRDVDLAQTTKAILDMELADLDADDFRARYSRARVRVQGVTP